MISAFTLRRTPLAAPPGSRQLSPDVTFRGTQVIKLNGPDDGVRAIQLMRPPLTSNVLSSSPVAAAIVSTALSKAAALCGAGWRKPLILRTYWSAAARMSSSVTDSAYGGRSVLMDLHILTTVRRGSDSAAQRRQLISMPSSMGNVTHW